METLLRDYQTKLLDDITTTAIKHRRILVTLPCGGGKTIIFLEIAKHALSTGKKILILSHRREIFWQIASRLQDMNIKCGIILADEPHDPTLKIQVASIQSLVSKAFRRNTITMPQADIVIVDESHHITSITWKKIVDYYPNAYLVGVTATPTRKNGVGLGSIFDHLIIGPSISDLTRDGWLVPVKYYCGTFADLQGIRVQAGDYVEKELESRMDKVKLIGDICENWSRICPDRKTIAFGCGVAHSKHIAEQFNQMGVKAAHLDGKTPSRERDRIIEEFRTGDLQVISNCQVWGEGVDIPSASCLIFARPTKSLVMYLQIAGRVLRPHPGKENALILDHSGVVYEHGTLDSDFDWKLDYGKAKTLNKTRAKKKESEVKKYIVCKKCKCLYVGRLVCPECGEIPTVKGKAVATYEAYLQELSADEKHKYSTEDKKLWWLGFKWYAEQHNYPGKSKDGLPSWAYAKFREKYNQWPHATYKFLPSQEPPKDVKAWILHSQIKFSKSRQRNEMKSPPNLEMVISNHGLFRKNLMAGDAYQQGE